MKIMTTLYADEGMILTDGENFGTTISLAEGQTAEDYKEITKEEYQEIQAKESEQVVL